MTPVERAKCYEIARGETADEAIARVKAHCAQKTDEIAKEKRHGA